MATLCSDHEWTVGSKIHTEQKAQQNGKGNAEIQQ